MKTKTTFHRSIIGGHFHNKELLNGRPHTASRMRFYILYALRCIPYCSKI